MPFLIDGHNVISALPDVELTDPHDEAKLVLKLRSWAARTRRKATIVFDGGLPGGYSRSLSGGGLEVVFAACRYTNADKIIKERLRHLLDAPNWTVVSSDHEVRDAARRVGARTLTAQAFVKRLGRSPRLKMGKPTSVSDEEVAEWLEVFGPAESADETTGDAKTPASGQKRTGTPKPRLGRSQRPMGKQVEWTEPSSRAGRPAKSPDDEKPLESSPEDVAHWLEVFGDEAAEAPPPKPPARRAEDKRALTVDKDRPETQSERDIETWLTMFSASRPEEAPPPDKPAPEDRARRSKTLREHKRRHGDGFEDKAEGLSDEDIAMWERLFGEESES